MDAREDYALAWSHEGLAGLDDWTCRIPQDLDRADPSTASRAPKPTTPTHEVARTCYMCGGSRAVNLRQETICRACDDLGLIVEEVSPSVAPRVTALLDSAIRYATANLTLAKEHYDAAA